MEIIWEPNWGAIIMGVFMFIIGVLAAKDSYRMGRRTGYRQGWNAGYSKGWKDNRDFGE